MKRFLPLAIVAASVAVAGCGSSSGDSGTAAGSAAPPAPAAKKSRVWFVTPHKDATTASTIHVRVGLANFRIVPGAVGQAPRPGEGHLHFKMDEGKFDRPRYAGKNGLLGKKLGVTGTYSPALAPTITYSHLPRGKHVLEVYLANNNHTVTGVEAKLKFRVG